MSNDTVKMTEPTRIGTVVMGGCWDNTAPHPQVLAPQQSRAAWVCKHGPKAWEGVFSPRVPTPVEQARENLTATPADRVPASREEIAQALYLVDHGAWTSGTGIRPPYGTPWGTSREADRHEEYLRRADAVLVVLRQDDAPAGPAAEAAVQGIAEADADAEVETETVTHWGAELSPGLVRWDPGHGSGHHVPYTEDEARHDVASTKDARLVTRTETTTVVTTPWVAVEDTDGD